MVDPRLLNPLKVEIEQTDEDATQFDPLRRTPVKVIKRTPKWAIDAQVKWTSMRGAVDPVAHPQGLEQREHGYLIVRVKDLAAIGKSFKEGDKIVTIGGLPVSLFVTKVEFGAHYGGKFKLMQINFEHRRGKGGSSG